VIVKFRIRRDTAANWTAENPVLGLGEPGLETDTRLVKYGDGATAWAGLDYAAVDAAARLATPRTINGVPFDGTANIAFDTDDVAEGANLYFTNARARTAVGGYTAPTDIPYSAGDFTGVGGMTWAVGPGDVIALVYSIIGGVMTLWFNLQTTSVGGTLGRFLDIAIPGGHTARNGVYGVFHIREGGVWSRGFVYTTTGGNTVRLEHGDNSNWAAATDATYMLGQLSFPIN